MNDLWASIRSEMVRIRRGWKLPAAALVLTVIASVFAYSGEGLGGPGGGATSTSTLTGDAMLEAADGIVAGLDIAGTLIALISLVFVALSVARDLQTGSIRVLLVGQSRRAVYLGGKLIALAVTVVTTGLVAVGISVAVGFAAAAGNDVSTAAWQWSEVWSALGNVTLMVLLWGGLGAVLAVVARSAAGAIAGGVGYMLLGENLLGSVWSSSGEWLPGGTSDNLLAGGTAELSWAQSACMGLTYVVAAAAVALVVLTRRDVTD